MPHEKVENAIIGRWSALTVKSETERKLCEA